MSWLRIDDGFTGNSKIAQLTDAEFRCWIRLLCHCAKSQDPSVDRAAIREVSGLTLARISRYSQTGLVDQIGDSYEIHNWAKYLPKDTQTERQARWRARVAQESASTTASTTASTNGAQEPSTKTSTRAQVRADSRPVPSEEQDRAVTSDDTDVDDTDVDPDPEQPLAEALDHYTNLIAKEIPL